MRWGAHLPLVDFGDGGARLGELCDVVCAARELGFDTVSANDHLLWRRPWLDGLTALSAVVEHATGMTMATSVALPAVRHPVVLAKSVATLAVLHNGPFIAGIGPGSGRADYAAVGVPFVERWRRFDEAARILRAVLRGENRLDASPDAMFAPVPDLAPQVWSASWGSALRLRAVADTADGWFASGYNTDPTRFAASRAQLDAELRRAGRDPAAFPDAIATMWLYVSSDAREAAAVVDDVLAPVLGRDPRTLARYLPVGTADHCITVLDAYARAGARRILLWPVRNPVRQLEMFAEHVAPHVPSVDSPRAF
jgi:alkanesulfonate monooxygenase SsuD/methylene tetrahydromethanopterin reductase-like flavin-dependent oxidoreductase (luciferase family)